MTPFVGILEDKFDTRIGSKIPWFIFGSFLNLPSVLGMFMAPDFPHGSSSEFAFYMVLPITFNVGFAFVQISCYSLVNNLTFST